ncbi:acylphosphatase [Actinomycetospora sp. NBRC 106375]|uniref:acylphosphatase n=1 Tax=Actinomycetospora sp. NBRC 106375 TaxID=3032207 RepID=UPI0024A1159D|nr:acylphosphatase [Actinomycetospora sp. NBRC 106375]GLZ44471.1 acylphosphatase [Actinomycetospora sp. NBRC 106375]
MQSKHIVVHGRVQGVFYRASAQDAAGDLGVAGWARNRDDGTVEMVVEGEDDAVEKMIAWAREGSSHARVTDVEVTDAEPQGLRTFETS